MFSYVLLKQCFKADDIFGADVDIKELFLIVYDGYPVGSLSRIS